MSRCKTPACQNEALPLFKDTFCGQCMRSTVRRILDYRGIWSKDDTTYPVPPDVLEMALAETKWVVENADALVEAEIAHRQGRLQ